MRNNRRPDGLVIAYMQARVGARRAVYALRRQHHIINEFRAAYRIPIDMWYYRAKGLSPLPTPEQLIEDGKVYTVIASEWDKLRGCKGHWPDVWELCNKYRVRKVCILNEQDFCARGERNVFRWGWWEWSRS